ncbi:hypothetical protein FXO37_18799 [Capsicum annuum]|nr:hypothetical protein FXO37_18799 [Capsicum annuum]
MGQRMLRFDFVSRDPPQVGFESRVMGDYPVRTVRRALLVCASRGLIFHQATIHFYPYIGLDLRGAAVTLEGVQGVELSEIVRKDGFINSTTPPVPALMWYVLTWPPTFCLKLRPPAQCIKPIRDHEFTLHGLWPADANGKTITCRITVPVDYNRLFRPIEAQLNTFWPELKENQPQYSIWIHEWEKHGVCGLTTAKEYFDAAIKTNGLFTRGNLYNYLASSNIVSSDHVAYTQDDIIKAIQTVFAPAPAPAPAPAAPAPAPAPAPLGVYLRCTAIDSTNTTHGYLSEAVVCTTMDGSNFVTCPPRARNCDKFPNIVIPPGPPSLAPAPAPTIPITLRSPRFQEETYVTYSTFEKSRAKFNEWLTLMFGLE